MLVGYGLVVGLNGTGDSLRDSVFTRESLIGMLERLGVNARDDNLRTRNVAAVMVTGTLQAFARQGGRLDVQVAAMGNTSDLRGGTLLVTPLVGADGQVYAVAQGIIAVSAVETLRTDLNVRGVPTSGRIPGGAIIELEIPFQLFDKDTINLSLRNPDFTTARRLARAVNNFIGDNAASIRDVGTVNLQLPASFEGNIVEFLAEIEQLRVSVDQPAIVVIDEQSGVIVMGDDVRINTVAIAHGNLAVRVTEDLLTSQIALLSNTSDAIGQDPAINAVDEDDDTLRQLGILPRGVTLQELVSGLNALGVNSRDLINILQVIRAAGALQAEIKII